MKYLLDTHYILWTLFEPDKLGSEVLSIFNNENDAKFVSGINFWEISLKFSLGKLSLDGIKPDQIFDKILESGFDVINITNEVLVSYYRLPKKENHRDPFDRLLIWQSIFHGYTLITKDKLIEQYISDGLNVKII